MCLYICVCVCVCVCKERAHLFHDGGSTTSSIKLGPHRDTARTQSAQSKRPRLKSPHTSANRCC